MKKILTSVLALAMCLAMLPTAALAAGDFTIRNGVLGKYTGPGGDVVVPDGITQIGMYAFMPAYESESMVTSIVLPDSVTEIGSGAFDGCINLTELVIGGGVTKMDYAVCYHCTSLTNVTIAQGTTVIGDHAFEGCTSLKSIIIPPSVTEIGERAFVRSYSPKLDSDTGTIIGLTIYGAAGSYAETYAKENRINFEAITDFTAQQPAGPQAMPTNDSLTVDGAAQNPTVYKIDGSNYFKIRDLAAMLNGTGKQFSVGYDAATNSVTATAGEGYTKLDTDLAGAPAGGNQTAVRSNDTIYINGVKADVEVYKIDGSNYFKLRDLGKALNFYVGWDAGRGVYIETDKPYAE